MITFDKSSLSSISEVNITSSSKTTRCLTGCLLEEEILENCPVLESARRSFRSELTLVLDLSSNLRSSVIVPLNPLSKQHVNLYITELRSEEKEVIMYFGVSSRVSSSGGKPCMIISILNSGTVLFKNFNCDI